RHWDKFWKDWRFVNPFCFLFCFNNVKDGEEQ
ncbi:MAG: hypothetical protein ACI81W_002102, partial [Saprospiraceae bacterium]